MRYTKHKLTGQRIYCLGANPPTDDLIEQGGWAPAKLWPFVVLHGGKLVARIEARSWRRAESERRKHVRTGELPKGCILDDWVYPETEVVERARSRHMTAWRKVYYANPAK